jgi:menaquinone-dependent protoporphyrinogen oxidase
MARVLIAYASTHGHTATIAERIAHVLRSAGHRVIVHDDVGSTDPPVHLYDAVVIGASVHRGHHQRDIVEWAEHNATSLNLCPSAFFSVCLAAAEDSEETRQAAHDYLDDFEERTGWAPRLRTTFAGALQYREYDLATRLVMRLMMARGGHPTDITRDTDYTDWNAVDAFARDCAKLCGGLRNAARGFHRCRCHECGRSSAA